MKAVYLDTGLQLKEIPRPAPGSGEALVKVRLAGICNTDLELVKGYMGFHGVLGHEFVGVVEAADTSDWVGRRVCGEINFGCGACAACRRGLSRHCPNRTVLGILNQNGAFAEYTVLPEANLHSLPDGVSDRQAVFVEPLAAALEILEQIRVEPDFDVAVVGDGKLGLLITQVLRLSGCRLTLVGKHPHKLQLARGWGVRVCERDALPEEPFDVVVEASGSPTGFNTALSLVRPRGTLVLKSTYHGKLELDAAPIVIDELRIVGSRCGPFAAAIRVLERGLVSVEPLIEAVYPLAQALEAFEHGGQAHSLKILLDVAGA